MIYKMLEKSKKASQEVETKKKKVPNEKSWL